jgi:hypothetical protein
VLAIVTIFITARGWSAARTQAHIDWVREQVAQLIGELQADHDRLRTAAVKVEVGSQERKYLNPALPFWDALSKLSRELDDAIEVMRKHASTLSFVSSGVLEVRARHLELSLMECSNALLGLSLLVGDKSPWDDDEKWKEFEATVKGWRGASDRLTEVHLRLVAEARRLVKAPWNPTLRMRTRHLGVGLLKLMRRVWNLVRRIGGRAKP